MVTTHTSDGTDAAPRRLLCDRVTYVGVAICVLLTFSVAFAQADGQSTSCRASAARASGSGQNSEPVVANPQTTPCITDSHEVSGSQSVGGQMTVTNPKAATDNSPGTLSGMASVDSAEIAIATPISVGHVSVRQAVQCVNGVNATSGNSSVDRLTVAGAPLSVASRLTRPLGV
jgi:hypothetical protein